MRKLEHSYFAGTSDKSTWCLPGKKFLVELLQFEPPYACTLVEERAFKHIKSRVNGFWLIAMQQRLLDITDIKHIGDLPFIKEGSLILNWSFFEMTQFWIVKWQRSH